MDLDMENQCELASDEEYDKFCGKVFLTTKRNIILHCTLCESKYFVFESYLNHLKIQHLNDSNESPDEECLESENCDELFSMHEEEMPINLLQKKTNISVHQKEATNDNSSANNIDSLFEDKIASSVNVDINAVDEPPIVNEIENRSRPTHIVTTEKGIFSCPHCPQRFMLEYSLKAHVKNHDKCRIFNCKVCGLQCKTSEMLRLHSRRHEKHKPHKCTECERSFINLSELQYHMRNHNGEKPYQCEDCGVRYAYRSSLKMHRKRHHTFQKDYVCPLCSKAFYNTCNLRNHMTKHTNEPSYECKKCSKKFNTSSCYERHKAQHRKQEDAVKEKAQIVSDEIFY